MRDNNSTLTQSDLTPIQICAASELAKHGKKSIFEAVMSGQTELCQAFLDLDNTLIEALDGWIQGKQPLMVAAEQGNSDIVVTLLARGAHVDALGWYNDTALMFAAEKGQEDIVALLLKHGADANRSNANGYSALYYAARNNNSACVDALLAHTSPQAVKHTLALLKNEASVGKVALEQVDAIEASLNTMTAETVV